MKGKPVKKEASAAPNATASKPENGGDLDDFLDQAMNAKPKPKASDMIGKEKNKYSKMLRQTTPAQRQAAAPAEKFQEAFECVRNPERNMMLQKIKRDQAKMGRIKRLSGVYWQELLAAHA